MNKNLENKYNKLNLLIKVLSNASQFQLIKVINENVMECNDVAEGIEYPIDSNTTQNAINQDTFILVNHSYRIKVLMQNYKLHSEIKSKINIYNKLVKERSNEDIINLVNIGKNAKLCCIQNCLNIVREENVKISHRVNKMKSQAKKLVIYKKKFENDHKSLIEIKQTVSRNNNDISLKSEMCLRKIIDINHQIIAGKTIFENLLNIFSALIDSNEKIHLFINNRVAQKSTCLESLNIVNKPDNNLLPVVLSYFQLLNENQHRLNLLKNILIKFKVFTDKSKCIEIYIEKMHTYFESLNQKNKEILTTINTSDNRFWNAVAKFESVTNDWLTLKTVALNN